MSEPLVNWRGLSASIASVVAILALVAAIGSDFYLLGVALVFLAVAALAIHGRSLGAQIFARAVWWSSLALGVVLCVLGGRREGEGGMVLALACGAALLVAGRHRLSAATSAAGYAPAALRSMLLLLMVFALADAQTFLVFGSIGLIDKHSDDTGLPLVMLPIGLSYIAGFVGLYRLQIWGALVSIATSVLVIALIYTTDAFYKMEKLSPFLTVLAVVHIVTALPVTIAALRGKELVSLSAVARSVITTCVTAGLMLLAVFAFVSRN